MIEKADGKDFWQIEHVCDEEGRRMETVAVISGDLKDVISAIEAGKISVNPRYVIIKKIDAVKALNENFNPKQDMHIKIEFGTFEEDSAPHEEENLSKELEFVYLGKRKPI